MRSQASEGTAFVPQLPSHSDRRAKIEKTATLHEVRCSSPAWSRAPIDNSSSAVHSRPLLQNGACIHRRILDHKPRGGGDGSLRLPCSAPGPTHHMATLLGHAGEDPSGECGCCRRPGPGAALPPEPPGARPVAQIWLSNMMSLFEIVGACNASYMPFVQVYLNLPMARPR